MSRSVAQKMRIKKGVRAVFVNAPALTLEAIELPDLAVSEDLDGDFDYIHLFSITQAQMNETFPKLKPHLKASGMLWMSWPKGKSWAPISAWPRSSKSATATASWRAPACGSTTLGQV